MTIRDELAAIRERAENATEGPWAPWIDQDGTAHMQGRLMVGNEEAVIPDGETYIDEVDVNPIAECYTPEDRRFIAHARTDVPRLVSALQAVVAIVEGVRFTGPPDTPKTPTHHVLDGLHRDLTRVIEEAMEAGA